MKIGILELMSAEAYHRWDRAAYGYLVTRQYASIMPQAISVWCRSLGHEVFYATYYGHQDPFKLLPKNLDIVFISTYTQASSLAYVLAKLWRKEKTLTVIGGPHAKQFPQDCLRFFDLVVGDCDQTLIAEILRDKPRAQIVTSGRSLKALPGVEERLPEIRSSTFLKGRPFYFNSVPVITSTGCPNSCDFCIDWNNPYALLPLDQMEADMTYIFKNLPKTIIAFHDPNFAIQFEKVFDVLEKIPYRGHNTFGMETSMTTLKGTRLERMHKLGRFYIIPGIENWASYSNKVGAGSAVSPRQKLEAVITQFNDIRPFVSGIQANFIFGLDVDSGNEPIELTREFASRVPFVMPNFNIPVPFGNTPLYDKYAAEDRLLTAMPFTFYYMPYLVFMLKNYEAAEFYEKLIELFSHVSSTKMLLTRLKTSPGLFPAGYNTIKTLGNRQMIARLKTIFNLLRTDSQFRAFHAHKTDELPRFYNHRYEQLLGPYAGLMSAEDRKPLLSMPKKPELPVTPRRITKTLPLPT